MKQILLVILASMALTGVAHAAGDVDAGKSKVAACAACHGAGGEGSGPAHFAALKGQSGVYVAKTLIDFKTGERANDHGGMMQDTAKKMSDEEIYAVSAFISRLR
jgi:cytochrome c553